MGYSPTRCKQKRACMVRFLPCTSAITMKRVFQVASSSSAWTQTCKNAGKTRVQTTVESQAQTQQHPCFILSSLFFSSHWDTLSAAQTHHIGSPSSLQFLLPGRLPFPLCLTHLCRTFIFQFKSLCLREVVHTFVWKKKCPQTWSLKTTILFSRNCGSATWAGQFFGLAPRITDALSVP